VERREGYWTLDEEVEILWQFMQIVQHPNCQVIGQNYHYDTQFFARELGLKSIPYFDTMVAQHTIWPGLPKALHFIASLYCDFYQFWKDEGREWDESMPEEQHWRYNCLDCVYTFEAYQRLDKLLDEMSQREQYKFQMRLFWPVLKMMLRGVRQSLPLRSKYLMECLEHMAQLEQKLADDLGHPLNPRSVPQLRTLFYTDFALRPVLHKKTKKPTCDDDALEVLATREPLIRSICDDINAFRSLGQFVGALKARLDPDMRMRASFGICGTETTRFNSGINPWGTGTNFQNVSTGERRPELNLPNVRRCFLADPGKILLEPDLAGADAQVVAWEANDEKLKAAFRAGLKIHAVNAKDIFGAQAGPDGRREPYYTRTKVGVHLTNYGGRARTCATALGLTVHEAERFQKRWFSIHPEILEWHRRIENELRTRRYVENKFGYRRYYFGRPESSLTEALAWVPQSTVAGTINRGLVNIDENLKWAQILIQVHDSLLIQIPKYLFPDQLPLIKKLLLVTIPYDDPLTIRTELKVSDVSWGDEKKYEEWDKMAA
jgi:DNA polymerase-1